MFTQLIPNSLTSNTHWRENTSAKQQWTDLGLLNRLLQEDYKKVSSISNNTQKALAMNPLKGKKTSTPNYYKKASSISNKMAMHSEVLEKGAHEPTEGKRLQHNSNRLQIQ